VSGNLEAVLEETGLVLCPLAHHFPAIITPLREDLPNVGPLLPDKVLGLQLGLLSTTSSFLLMTSCVPPEGEALEVAVAVAELSNYGHETHFRPKAAMIIVGVCTWFGRRPFAKRVWYQLLFIYSLLLRPCWWFGCGGCLRLV